MLFVCLLVCFLPLRLRGLQWEADTSSTASGCGQAQSEGSKKFREERERVLFSFRFSLSLSLSHSQFARASHAGAPSCEWTHFERSHVLGGFSHTWKSREGFENEVLMPALFALTLSGT